MGMVSAAEFLGDCGIGKHVITKIFPRGFPSCLDLGGKSLPLNSQTVINHCPETI
jgi:hypothetical protein